MVSDPRTVDVAIVGVGPKGFGCLERLVIETNRCPDPPRLRVSLHDPASHPGAGPIYDPAQPSYLLVNFPARNIDIWSRDVEDLGRATRRVSRSGLGEDRPDLVSWLAVHHPAWADGEAIVPRRLVGAYLQAAFAVLLGALPPPLTVDRVVGIVTDVQRCGSGWWVRHRDPSRDRYVAEVMITVGHGTWSVSGASVDPAREPTGHRTTMIAPPYPVATRLGPHRIPASATVAVRGFALSFIDVTLALTVGRGGHFEGVDSGATAPARYHASGAEVQRVVPYSRTGLPLLAKPGPELVAQAGERSHVWDRLRERIRATTGSPLLPGLRDAFAEAVQAALPGVHGTVLDPDPDPGDDRRPAGRSLAVMRRSVEVATGQRPPDAVWAIGEAWRQAYPALVRRVGHGGVSPTERPALEALIVRMERLAFGAPAGNLHRMVVLADAGLLDLGHLRSPRVITHGAGIALVTDGRRTPIDVLVDAVIEPPGIASDSPLWGRLLRRGQVRVAPGTRGVEVTADARCLDGGGRAVVGLSAVGRATEGWILGNDTLRRTLHDETRRWAHRIVTDGRATDGHATDALAPTTMVSEPASGPRP